MSNGNDETSSWLNAIAEARKIYEQDSQEQEIEEKEIEDQEKNIVDDSFSWKKAIDLQIAETQKQVKKPEPSKSKEEGFNLFTEFTDSFNAITQGGKVGLTMAETTDEFSQIMRSGGESTKEDIQNAFEAIQKINNAAPIEAMEEWNQAYDKYIEKGDNAIQATYKATMETGTDGFLGVMAQSVASLSNIETLAAATGGAGVGAAAGFAGGIFAPVTVAGGALSGGFAAANAYSESVNRFSQNMQAAIRDAGKEVTPETIEEFLNDEDLFESVQMKSIAAGSTIGVIEGAATLVGGKAISSIARATRGVTSATGRIGVKAAKGAAAFGVEGVGGSLGEAGAQAIEGRGLDTKEIIIEGIAGLGGAPKTAVVGGFSALNTKAGRYKVNGGLASRGEIIKILESDKITDVEKASIDFEIKNDNDLYSRVSELQSDIEIKSEIDDRIIDKTDRDRFFELEKEVKKLENKKTVSSKNKLAEVKSEIKEITDKYKDIDRRIKAVKDNKSKRAAIKKASRERRVRRDIEFIKQSGSQVRAFDTADELLADLDKLNKTLPKEQKIKLSKQERSDIKNAGGFYDAPNNVVYVNKSVAADLQNTVGSHEVLHGILFRYAGNAAKQKILVEKFQSKLSQRQRNIVDTLMKKRNYDISVDSKGNRSSQYYTEYLTNFSDALNIKNEDGTSLIEFEENIFTKLGDVLTPILRSIGFKKISFDSGQGVYNFMKEYNKSIEKGEFTEDLSSFLKQKKPFSQSQLNKVQNQINFSREVVSKQEKIDGLVGEKNIDGNYKLTKQEWDAGKGDAVLGDIFTNQDLQGLIKSKIPPVKFRQPGFSEEDFVSATTEELIPHIRNFNPEKNNSLSGWINSQLDNKIKNVYKKGEAATRDKFEDELTERVDVAEEEVVAEEKPKQQKPLFRESIGIDKKTGLYKKILDSVVKDFEDNFMNYYNKTTGQINPSVWKKLQKNFETQFSVDIKKLMSGGISGGKKAKENFVNFLKSNRVNIVEKLPIRDLVALDRKSKTPIFTELIKKQLTPLEARAAKDIGAIKAKTETQSPNLYKKKTPTEKQFLEFFEDASGKRKNSLANSIGTALAFDAYTKVLTDSDLSKYASDEVVSEGIIAQMGVEIERDVNNVNFALPIKETAPGIQFDLNDEEFQTLKERDGINILNKVLEVTKRVTKKVKKEKDPRKKIQELLEGKEGEYQKLREKGKVSDAVTIKILKILQQYNQIRNERVGGVIQEITVFNLIRIDNAKDGKITLLKGTAMNDDSRPDIQIHYKGHVYQEKDRKTIDELNKKLPEGKEEIKVGDPIIVGVEVKKDFGADFGSSVLSVDEDFVNNKGKGKITFTNKKLNFEFLEAVLRNVLPAQLNKFFDFLDKQEIALGRNPVKRSTIKEKGPDGKAFKQRISDKTKEAWMDRVIKDFKIGGTFNSNDINLGKIAKYYREKGNSYLEVANSGLFYLGDDDKGNIFHAPLLINQKNLDVKVVVTAKFDAIKDSNDIKTGESTFRIRGELRIDPKAGKPIPVSKSKPSGKKLSITDGKSIDDNIKYYNKKNVNYSKNINEEFNKILEESQGVEATKRYSRRSATREGARKGRYKFFVPPSADNFMGLMYSFLGKGKVGERHKDFFEYNLMSPYKRGISAMDSQRQRITDEYKGIKKKHFKYIDQLKLESKLTGEHVPNTNFNKDAAVRVYLWNKQGVKNSDLDLTQKEVDTLVEFVKSDKQLLAFADDLGTMKSFDGKYPEPQEFWEGSTIVSDLSYSIDNARSEYLNEFIENSNEIFSEENLNKIEATYGPKFREALEGSLNSMKSGVLRRPLKKGSVEQKWYDWLNNSTATVMFFNVRSAILQTISSVNYLNWSDNNPVQAARAFANQKQFWKDFTFLFNSDKLRQRRAGTKINIAEAEISAAVQGKDGVNQTRSVIKTLLNKGFFFTQIADSFAIALGGASMYRNRVNSNIKKGMTVQEAEKAAFEDFDQITEETQQSSDPAEISQQQRSHFGRILLAFANTPMQYARLTKKAYLDLVNNRGDRKTNLSKLAYYAVVQNILFTGMQTALFATLGLGGDDEDDEKKQEKTKKLLKRQIDFATNGIVDSFLRGGLGYTGAVVAGLKNAILELYKQKQSDSIFAKDIARIENDLLSISPPIGTFFGKLYSGYKTSEIEKDVIEAKGFKFDSPIYEIGTKGVSAFTNIPADRALLTIRNITAATKENYETWERVLLTLGWSTWDLGLENHEHELIKTTAKDARRKEGYRKASETRRKNREAKLQDRRRGLDEDKDKGDRRRGSSDQDKRRRRR